MKPIWISAVLPIVALMVPSAPTPIATHTQTMQQAKGFSVKFRVVTAGQPAEEHALSMSRDLGLRYETPKSLHVSNGKTLTSFNKVARTYTVAPATKEAVLAMLGDDSIWAWTAFWNPEWAKAVTSTKETGESSVRGVILRSIQASRPTGMVGLQFDEKLGVFRGGSSKRNGVEVFVQVTEISLRSEPLADAVFAWTPPADAKEAASRPAENKLVFADIKPILEQYCVRCHGGARATRGINMVSYDSIMASRTVKPGDSRTSIFVNSMRTGAMPKGGTMPASDIDKIAKWVDDGALN